MLVILLEDKDLDGSIYKLLLSKDEEIIGEIFVDQHPEDKSGAEVHLEIKPEWRKRWLSRTFKYLILDALIEGAKNHKIKLLYSTALTAISPRLLEFFGFKEYYKQLPKTYYYLEVNNG